MLIAEGLIGAVFFLVECSFACFDHLSMTLRGGVRKWNLVYRLLGDGMEM